MLPIIEAFAPEVRDSVTDIYVTDGIHFWSIYSAERPTTRAFGIIDVNKKILLTADDFRWSKDDGSDRNFKNDYIEEYYSYDMPKKLSAYLTSFICVKFAREKLVKAKDALNCTDETAAKVALDEAIENFEKATKAKKKLEIALSALENALDISGEDEGTLLITEVNEDTSIELCDAIGVIDEVIYEI